LLVLRAMESLHADKDIHAKPRIGNPPIHINRYFTCESIKACREYCRICLKNATCGAGPDIQTFRIHEAHTESGGNQPQLVSCETPAHKLLSAFSFENSSIS
jgi:hypothetical protein